MNHVLSWDEYFMSVALLSAMRSKDPNTKVGACIVNADQHIVGTGYNGMPKGDDATFSWAREGAFLETKYPYVVHAELNAILNSTVSLSKCVMYVSLFPCHECAKAIVQAGIAKLVYLSDKYHGTPENEASKRILHVGGVEMETMDFNREILLQNVEKLKGE